MWNSGFLMPTVCLAHAVAGILLLGNRFVPLALMLHLPVSLQMVLFHLSLDPRTGAIAYLILTLNVFLIWVHQESFSALLQARPASPPADSGDQ